MCQVHHNKCYGLDPHDDSDFMTITDNEIHHNGCHGVGEAKEIRERPAALFVPMLQVLLNRVFG